VGRGASRGGACGARRRWKAQQACETLGTPIAISASAPGHIACTTRAGPAPDARSERWSCPASSRLFFALEFHGGPVGCALPLRDIAVDPHLPAPPRRAAVHPGQDPVTMREAISCLARGWGGRLCLSA